MAEGLPEAFDVAGRRTQMFPALSPAQVARVRRIGTVKTFEDGGILFEQGDTAVPFYVVLEGEIAIVHPTCGVEEPVTTHKQHEFTGEVAALAGRPTLVRGRARGHLQVICVDNAKFHALLQTDSELSEVIMRAYILRRMGLLSEGRGDVAIIGSRHSAATLRLQEFLVRNGHPFKYVDVETDPDVEQTLERTRTAASDIPIVICSDMRVLKNPTEAELADCLHLNERLEEGVVHDVVICGAGPGGLAAAVYAASEGLDVLVVDAASPGGQAASSSKIENYFGFPTGVSGQALAARGNAQAEKFGAKLLVARAAVKLRCGEGYVGLDLSSGDSLRARAVVLAMGVDYRKLGVPNRERFDSAGVYYAATFVEARRCISDDVIVVGGGNSAGQAATFLARHARRVELLVRGPDLAASMSRYLIRRIEETPNITLRLRTRIVGLHGTEQLERVTWRDDASGEETTRPIQHVFSMTGAAPNTDWLRGSIALDDNGFVRTDSELTDRMLAEHGWAQPRRPLLFETSCPRVFAVGDVRSNSVKRVASAVGEGSVCIQLVHKALTETHS